MRNDAPIKEYKYVGSLAKMCDDFIAEKRAVGYSYTSEAKKLYSFSRFTLDFALPVNTLTEEIVRAWIVKNPNETDKNRHSRYSLIKQFAEYMTRMGYSAYIPCKDDVGRCRKSFIPYIFTHAEIARFFKQANAMKQKPKSIAPRRHIIMPVIFRMLYCCGLRVSEATELRGEDVDLENGILLIRKSKFSKTRYVPMSEELTAVCEKYNETRLVGNGDYDWFFAAPDGGHYDSRSIYSVFRELLWNAGISHGGTGKGPRVHDFRHTFSVHCLQKWVETGADPTTVLPRLSSYLGHNGLDSTEQYLRMTAEVYPEISALMEREYGYIIPKFGGDSYEIA